MSWKQEDRPPLCIGNEIFISTPAACVCYLIPVCNTDLAQLMIDSWHTLYTLNRLSLNVYTNKLLNKIQGYCTRNALHGLYTIAKSEGLTGVQKGLIPGLWYQMTMNGLRLGTFQILTNLGYTTTPTGEYSIPRNIAASAVAGGLATWVGSPFYLVGFFVHRFFLLLLCQTSVAVSLWGFL